jgi:hypothetical protein
LEVLILKDLVSGLVESGYVVSEEEKQKDNPEALRTLRLMGEAKNEKAAALRGAG